MRPGKASGGPSAAPEAAGKAQGVQGVRQGAGRESCVVQPLEHRGKEMGTTLPAPLKPVHGGRENQGEKRQQLGAKPASSGGEGLGKDRACIVPWGLHCPTLPDTMLTPFLSLRTAWPPPAQDADSYSTFT